MLSANSFSMSICPQSRMSWRLYYTFFRTITVGYPRRQATFWREPHGDETSYRKSNESPCLAQSLIVPREQFRLGLIMKVAAGRSSLIISSFQRAEHLSRLVTVQVAVSATSGPKLSYTARQQSESSVVYSGCLGAVW